MKHEDGRLETSQSEDGGQEDARPSVTSLLHGIVKDTKDLFSQELTAIKLEVEENLQQQKNALLRVGAGAAISCVGGVLLGHMAVHALAAHVQMPLWSLYGCVGGVLMIVGLSLCMKE